MKLHRNAALSWRGRRQLARRVVDQGWTLKAAAKEFDDRGKALEANLQELKRLLAEPEQAS